MLNKYLVTVGSLFFFIAAPGPASALDAGFHYKLGYDFGGDTLATVTFTNGDTESVKANEGIYLGAGVSLINDAKNLETEISLSYKFGGSFAENGDITFTAMPLDVVLFHRWTHVRLGGGLTYQLSPELEVSGAGSAFARNTKYDDALGFVVQVDYRLLENMNIGVRYTAIEYETSGSSRAIDGNTLGIVFSGHL